MSGSGLARGLLALSGGLALFLADYPVSQPWLVLLAFAPLLWVTLAARSRREAGAYGILWGLGRTVPLAYMLGAFGLPVPARFAVEAYLLGLDGVFALVAFELRARRAWPLLVALTFAVIEYADSLLPMWGTARCVARLLSPYPGPAGYCAWAELLPSLPRWCWFRHSSWLAFSVATSRQPLPGLSCLLLRRC